MRSLHSYAEKLTKALFSFASKLAPVIIFVDEVDSLLGARGGSFEHEATRRMRNEFMASRDTSIGFYCAIFSKVDKGKRKALNAKEFTGVVKDIEVGVNIEKLKQALAARW
ncbi:unnamed protein product [Microthlaspi erraticum]|uniref:ATPase AAA-type core domain-containing protein n=1 Tax=Microthlaspi erraticum TaxID=1685480 RepID=A0A6D2IGV4_9BRAS|nr:unnamed protein product [Microthlaspi erraticum]